MNQSQIIELQRHIGTAPDGYWGPKSIAACKRHLEALMPIGGAWPSPEDTSMIRFFGRPRDESSLVPLDVTGLSVKYDGQSVRSIQCHKLVAASLGRILRRISDGPHRGILAKYAGCYNPRPMRGGNRPSKHSWGACRKTDASAQPAEHPVLAIRHAAFYRLRTKFQEPLGALQGQLLWPKTHHAPTG